MARSDDVNLQPWVDDRLATLTPDAEWDPSMPRGLERLRKGDDRPHRRWVVWIATGATAAVLVMAPSPALRAFVHQCGEFIARNLPASMGGRMAPRPAIPDFTWDDAAGRPVTLSASRGKVVLLTFWTTSCGQCRAEMSWFSEFQKTYRDRGLEVIGVSLDRAGWPSVGPYLQRQSINYRVVVSDRDVVRPAIGSSIPTTLILDRDGRVAVRHVGFCSKEEYRRDIQKILAE
jgi:peroxiredoxin